jgi:hypothetical protein
VNQDIQALIQDIHNFACAFPSAFSASGGLLRARSVGSVRSCAPTQPRTAVGRVRARVPQCALLALCARALQRLCAAHAA